MKLNKCFAAGLTCTLLATAWLTPASAHGHHGGGHHNWHCQTTQTTVTQYVPATSTQTAPAVQPAAEQPVVITTCPVADCAIAGRHTHDGVTYCGYAHENGICDGNCCALCTRRGCIILKPHSHQGVPYCGHEHAAGFCDGGCW